jgi:glycosyltransferase involved in cell wall biosynthesis
LRGSQASQQSSGEARLAPTREELRVQLRSELGIRPEALVIGYCGRLHKDHPVYKGVTELLQIGQRIRGAEAGVELLLAGIGSPDDGAWVESFGAKALLNLPPERMPAFYSAIDIYATASKWEGFDLPIVEAAWHGVPTVAYNIGAHSETTTSVLVHDVRPSELGRALLTLVRDAKLRCSFAAEALKRSRHFSWDRATDEFEAVLQELGR